MLQRPSAVEVVPALAGVGSVAEVASGVVAASAAVALGVVPGCTSLAVAVASVVERLPPDPAACVRLRSTIPAADLTTASAIAVIGDMGGVIQTIAGAIPITAATRIMATTTAAGAPGLSRAASSEQRPHTRITITHTTHIRHRSRRRSADIVRLRSGPAP